MTFPTAPIGWFDVLLERDDDRGGRGLPDAFRAVYGGDWRLPDGAEPYICVNFCTSRDGRVSFSEPGHVGGGDVSGFDERDRWLMGLLRARADAVAVGDGTMRAEPGHLWTSAGICPADADAFAGLREAEGRRPSPLQVFVSKNADIPWDAEVFGHPELEIVVATNGDGKAARAAAGRCAAPVEVLTFGDDGVDFGLLAQMLYERHGVRTIVCEGGPRLYGTILRTRLAFDEFVTLSPLVLGDDGVGPYRPSLVEGVRFPPGSAPRSQLRSVRVAGDHLYLRSRYG